MKLRSTFLALAALLLISSLASAAALSTPADPANANLTAIFTAPGSADGAATAQLPSFVPAPTEKAGHLCSSCSDTICVGKTEGTTCKILGTKVYKCQAAIFVCSAFDCQCWNGPLP
jgi:hypothetical protein